MSPNIWATFVQKICWQEIPKIAQSGRTDCFAKKQKKVFCDCLVEAETLFPDERKYFF